MCTYLLFKNYLYLPNSRISNEPVCQLSRRGHLRGFEVSVLVRADLSRTGRAKPKRCSGSPWAVRQAWPRAELGSSGGLRTATPRPAACSSRSTVQQINRCYRQDIPSVDPRPL